MGEKGQVGTGSATGVGGPGVDRNETPSNSFNDSGLPINGTPSNSITGLGGSSTGMAQFAGGSSIPSGAGASSMSPGSLGNAAPAAPSGPSTAQMPGAGGEKGQAAGPVYRSGGDTATGSGGSGEGGGEQPPNSGGGSGGSSGGGTPPNPFDGLGVFGSLK